LLVDLSPDVPLRFPFTRTGVAPLLREHLEKGNTLRLRLRGRSMFPRLRPGDVLGITTARRYAAGDILAYVQGGEVVVHRLQNDDLETGGRLALRGDAWLRADPPIPRERVLGRVTSIHRSGRVIQIDTVRGRLLTWLALQSIGRRPPIAFACGAARWFKRALRNRRRLVMR
jgi:hypothetical protein